MDGWMDIIIYVCIYLCVFGSWAKEFQDAQVAFEW